MGDANFDVCWQSYTNVAWSDSSHGNWEQFSSYAPRALKANVVFTSFYLFCLTLVQNDAS